MPQGKTSSLFNFTTKYTKLESKSNCLASLFILRVKNNFWFCGQSYWKSSSVQYKYQLIFVSSFILKISGCEHHQLLQQLEWWHGILCPMPPLLARCFRFQPTGSQAAQGKLCHCFRCCRVCNFNTNMPTYHTKFPKLGNSKLFCYCLLVAYSSHFYKLDQFSKISLHKNAACNVMFIKNKPQNAMPAKEWNFSPGKPDRLHFIGCNVWIIFPFYFVTGRREV